MKPIKRENVYGEKTRRTHEEKEREREMILMEWFKKGRHQYGALTIRKNNALRIIDHED